MKYTISPTQIGKGHAGTVYKALNKENNKMYVIKIINSKTNKVLREIRTLKELQDAPNFLPIRDILIDPEKFGFPFTLVFDHFHSKPIEEIRKTLTKFQMKKFIYEIFRTLDYVHSKGIMHRDIKFPNVLMNPETLEVKVIDFGISEYYLPGKQLPSKMGTLNYKAPELFLGYGFYDYSIDIWAAGVMLAEMMFRKKHVFQSTKKFENVNLSEKEMKLLRNGNQLDAIAGIMGTVDLLQYASKYQDKMDFKYLKFVGDHKKVNWKDFVDRSNEDLVDNEGLDLLGKLLVIDHTKRITAKEAMEHKFFDEIKDR